MEFLLQFDVNRDIAVSTYGERAVFQEQFLRCRSLLHFLACRVLGTDQGAEDAVENCRTTASCNPQNVDCESAFRSWLVRILIDEALLILRKRRAAQLMYRAE